MKIANVTLLDKFSEVLQQLQGPRTKRHVSCPRVKTNTVLQMEAVECGAASLAMVLEFYGKIIPLEELRITCGVSRDGSKASNILRAARSYGLKARGARKEPEDLRLMSGPMIIHWNFSHFLVLEGFKKGKVYLNDPSGGRRTVSVEEFNESYTGIALILELSADFQKSGQKPSLANALKKRLVGSKSALVYIVLFGLLLVLPGLLMPAFTRVFVDDILLANRSGWLAPLILGLAVTSMFQIVINWFRQCYLLRLEAKIAISTSGKFFWHVLHLPIEFFMQRFGGEIGSRVQINDRVANLLAARLATAILDCIVIGFYLMIMVQYDVGLTLTAVIFASMNMVLLKYMSQLRIDQNRALLQERGKLFSVSLSGLHLIETLKASGGEGDFFAKWAGYQAQLSSSEQGVEVVSQILVAVPALLTWLASTAILLVGSFAVLDGRLTIGMLVAFQGLTFSFMDPVARLVGLGTTLQEVEGDMNRLDDVLRYPLDKMVTSPVEPKDGSGETEFTGKLVGYVELKNIYFGYSRLEAPLLENFSLKLEPGMRVALIGGSGSGKSTIAKLVAGLYRPWEGEILFDVQTRDQIPQAILCSSVAVVDQDISMFEGTVRENISLWDSSIPEGDIIQAAKDACIHDEISLKKDSYESKVDEGGRNFSGGQCQRLEIARALSGNPTILILDEATSSLDPLTEKIIDDNLRRRGVTCLIVAHRLSTIRDCDEIIVLERGKVMQRGKHETMKNIPGPYQQLINAEESLVSMEGGG